MEDGSFKIVLAEDGSFGKAGESKVLPSNWDTVKGSCPRRSLKAPPDGSFSFNGKKLIDSSRFREFANAAQLSEDMSIIMSSNGPLLNTHILIDNEFEVPKNALGYLHHKDIGMIICEDGILCLKYSFVEGLADLMFQCSRLKELRLRRKVFLRCLKIHLDAVHHALDDLFNCDLQDLFGGGAFDPNRPSETFRKWLLGATIGEIDAAKQICMTRFSLIEGLCDQFLVPELEMSKELTVRLLPCAKSSSPFDRLLSNLRGLHPLMVSSDKFYTFLLEHVRSVEEGEEESAAKLDPNDLKVILGYNFGREDLESSYPVNLALLLRENVRDMVQIKTEKIPLKGITKFKIFSDSALLFLTDQIVLCDFEEENDCCKIGLRNLIPDLTSDSVICRTNMRLRQRDFDLHTLKGALTRSLGCTLKDLTGFSRIGQEHLLFVAVTETSAFLCTVNFYDDLNVCLEIIRGSEVYASERSLVAIKPLDNIKATIYELST